MGRPVLIVEMQLCKTTAVFITLIIYSRNKKEESNKVEI